MKDKKTTALQRIGRLVAVIVVTTLIVGIAFGVCAWYDFFHGGEDYHESANWSCDIETFSSEYYPLYIQEIERLKEKHKLSFEIEERVIEDDNDIEYIVNLKSGQYQIRISFYDCYTTYMNYSEYKVQLDCYTFDDYSEIAPIVEFINDITNYAAFDTIVDENRFETLYKEAIASSNPHANDKYHFDHLIGYVGYQAGVSDGNPYFIFEGMLKPLI